MPTLKAKVESYVGTLDSTENTSLSDFICHSANKLIATLPGELIKRSATGTSVTSGGLTITNTRVFYVAGSSGYEAVQVSPADATKYTASTSLFKATDLAPVWYETGGKLYVINSSGAGNGTAHLISYLTSVTAGSDTSISNLPLHVERLAIIDAAIQVLLYRANDKLKTSVAALSYSNITVPTAPSNLTLSGAPTSPTAPSDLSLTTPYSELDTVLDTEEDVELAEAKLAEIRIRIEEWQANIQRYNANIQKFSADIEKYNIELPEYREDIANYAAQIQSYAQQIQGLTLDVTKFYKMYDSLITEIGALNKLYNENLQHLLTGYIQPESGNNK